MHQKKRKLNSIRLTLAVVILYHCIRQKKEHESEAQKLRHHIANKVFENRINKHFSARIPDIDDSSEIEGQEIQRTPRKVTILYNSAPNATVNIPASPSTRDQDSNSGSGQKQKRRGSKKKMKTMINSKGKVSIRDVKKASGLTENFVHLDDILTTERTTESTVYIVDSLCLLQTPLHLHLQLIWHTAFPTTRCFVGLSPRFGLIRSLPEAMFLLRQSLAPRLISVRRLHASSLLNGPLVPFKLADIGEGIAEVQVKEWYIKEGDRVHQFDNICEVQSDKAAVSITSRYDGIVKKLYYKVDDVAKVGKPLIDIELSDGEEILETEANVVPESASSVYGSISCEVPGTQNKKLATPAVRRAAMENKVDLSTVDGTGKGGRVLKEDVMRSLGQITKDPTPTSFTPHVRSDSAQTPKKSPLQPLKEDQVVPVRGYARAMVKSMSEALKIPHLGYNDEVNMDKVIELRNLLKKQEQERGIKMSYMPMFIKAASMALTKFPMINSCAHEKFENIIYKASHNICFAMDTPGGLVVPNIKNCEQRNLWEIAAELNRLIEAGKRQKISKEDITGGTFTLSNIGAIGGTSVNPIIFAPQVAIAGLGKIQNLPRVDGNGQVYTTHLVEVSWAADHRVVDGATVARFSNLFKVYLENLEIMIADMR